MNDTKTKVIYPDSKNESPMKCIPEMERPYEKCLDKGAGALSDAELLAVLLRNGVIGESALDLSRKILNRCKTQKGLLGLHHLSYNDLIQIHGVGKVKAIQILCLCELSKRFARSSYTQEVIFHTPEDVAEYYMEEMRHLEQEILMLAMLDAKGMLIADQILSKGTVNSSLSSAREIFIEAMKCQAVSVILLHNHPSGNPEPSSNDIQFTESVRQAGKLIGIELLDHIIIGDRLAVSLREQGCWQ